MKNLSRKEAMEILNDMKVKIEIPKAAVMQYKRNAALDMAIEALRCSETPNTSDTISRQAAIEALKHDEEYDEDIPNRADGVRDAIITISSLPSAQPEIIQCRDCKHYNAGFECLIEGYGIERSADWYCADAERRTDEQV